MGIRCIRLYGANKLNTEPETVFICFQDLEISLVFGSLLRSRGIKVKLLPSPADATPEMRMITEPNYWQSFAPSNRPQCLVVGDKDALLGLTGAVTLSRPLSEEKIEQALAEFLAA